MVSTPSKSVSASNGVPAKNGRIGLTGDRLHIFYGKRAERGDEVVSRVRRSSNPPSTRRVRSRSEIRRPRSRTKIARRALQGRTKSIADRSRKVAAHRGAGHFNRVLRLSPRPRASRVLDASQNSFHMTTSAPSRRSTPRSRSCPGALPKLWQLQQASEPAYVVRRHALGKSYTVASRTCESVRIVPRIQSIRVVCPCDCFFADEVCFAQTVLDVLRADFAWFAIFRVLFFAYQQIVRPGSLPDSGHFRTRLFSHSDEPPLIA